MVGHGGSSAGSYLADPTSPIPSHCASIVATSTLRVNLEADLYILAALYIMMIWSIDSEDMFDSLARYETSTDMTCYSLQEKKPHRCGRIEGNGF